MYCASCIDSVHNLLWFFNLIFLLGIGVEREIWLKQDSMVDTDKIGQYDDQKSSYSISMCVGMQHAGVCAGVFCQSKQVCTKTRFVRT